MIVPTVVLLVSGVVILVGGVAELLDTARARRAPALVSGADGLEERRDVADVGRWPMLAWAGLAAFAILGAAAIADRRPDIDDLVLIVLTLGFAGDRAFYLIRRRRSGGGQALPAEILALVVGAIGLLVGLTL